MKLCGLSKEGESLFKKICDQPAEFELMTTLRFDPKMKHLTRRVPIAMEDSDDDVFFLSKLHHRRLKYGAQLLNWPIQISHTQMVAKMNEAISSFGTDLPQRVRIVVNQEGVMDVQSSVVPDRDDLFSGLSTSPPKENSLDPVFDVYLSPNIHEPKVTNMIKTSDRNEYDELRKGLKLTEEVLLVGTNNEILEGTMTSVAFKRNNEWITPKLDNGGMVGTTRSLLLGLGFVKEGIILANEVEDGERVMLFNGVQGVVTGFIRRR